jgi:hypothetical protein
MFRLQVTIIRQTFYYMDRTFSVLQYGIRLIRHCRLKKVLAQQFMTLVLKFLYKLMDLA